MLCSNIAHFKRKMLLMSAAVLLVAAAAILAGGLLSAPKAEAAKRTANAIVIFTANWCASCRTVIPVAQEVASQNGLGVETIDVDKQDAPSQASDFGLSIPSADLPQVYYVNNGRITLLFDARQYKFAKPEIIRTQILSNLQQSKSS
ncbi:MAG: thioredoxin family protein [Vampirovibrionales bacterium]|nr:thioredoxin family protein [Vampirovibrionales bacterium]